MTVSPAAAEPLPEHAAALPADPVLERALSALVDDGRLDPTQADAVRSAWLAEALAAAVAPQPTGPPTAVPEAGAPPTGPPPRRRNPLPEIVGYVGAALVASAALNLVLLSWDTWSRVLRLTVAGTATAAVLITAVALVAAAGGRAGLARASAGRRRLVAVLLAIGTPLAGLTTWLALDAAGLADQDAAVVLAGGVALLTAAVGLAVVRTVLGTLAVAVGTVWLAAGLGTAWLPEPTTWAEPVAVAGLAALWLAVAPRLLPVPVLSEALGWAFLLMPLMGSASWTPPPDDEFRLPSEQVMLDEWQVQAWTARGLLVLAAVVGMAVFLRGGRWPWAAGGVTAGVMAALTIGGQTLNWVMALLIAGVVLLALSAILIVLRRRSERRAAAQQPATGPPGPPGPPGPVTSAREP